MWSRQRRRQFRNRLVGLIGPVVIRLWTKSLRIHLSGLAVEDGAFILPRAIFVMWHQRLHTLTGCFRDLGVLTLVSQHADGELLARLLHGLGYGAIRGSTTRGGVRALREILEQAGGNARIAVTPDGPRGPPLVMQQGPIYLASQLGLPIVPATASFSHARRLKTWDEFLVPRPFTRALIRLGDPQHVPDGLDREGLEEHRKKIEMYCRAFTEETDRDFEKLYQETAALTKIRAP